MTGCRVVVCGDVEEALGIKCISTLYHDFVNISIAVDSVHAVDSVDTVIPDAEVSEGHLRIGYLHSLVTVSTESTVSTTSCVPSSRLLSRPLLPQ